MKYLLSLVLALAIAPSAFAADPISAQAVRIVSPLPLPVIAVSSGTVAPSSFTVVNLPITVSGGSGYAVFSATGSLNQCTLIAPSSPVYYNFHILTEDADQFDILGKDGLTDIKVGLYALRYLMGSHRAQVSGSTVNGVFKFRCVVKL